MSADSTVAGGQLREIPGPALLGPDRRRFWDLIWLTSVAEFKLMYVGTFFGSVLGYVWALARPLLTFAVIYVVFSELLGVGASVPNYAAMLLFNLTLFFFLAETSNRAVQSYVASEGVLRKMQFPRAVTPLSVVLTGLFTFALNLVAIFVLVLLVGTPPLWTWLLLPLLWLAMLIFTTAVSIMLASLFVRFRDIAQIWAVVSMMLFYFSPIMYPVELIPPDYNWLLIINPIAPIFEQMRIWAVDPSGESVVQATGSIWGLLGPALIFTTVCAYAAILVVRRAPTMAEDL